MMNANWIYALRARPFMEDVKEAGMVTLLGMVAIFAVLALLWLLIEVLHRLLTKPQKPINQSKAAAAPTKETAQSPAPVPVEESTSATKEDDGALIAAITAAISATMAEEGYTGGFRVVSFKRASVRKNGRG